MTIGIIYWSELTSSIQGLGPHIGNVLCGQGMYQAHEFASSEGEGTLVSLLGHFTVRAPVEGLVL